MHVPCGTESHLKDPVDRGMNSEDLQSVCAALWHCVQRGKRSRFPHGEGGQCREGSQREGEQRTFLSIAPCSTGLIS